MKSTSSQLKGVPAKPVHHAHGITRKLIHAIDVFAAVVFLQPVYHTHGITRKLFHAIVVFAAVVFLRPVCKHPRHHAETKRCHRRLRGRGVLATHV